MSHDYLKPQLIDLLNQDFQLVFYDQRASGRSTGMEDTPRITMSQFVKDLKALRIHLKLEKLNILGHSFGGLLGMYYAIAYPRNVDKILLLDSSPANWELNFPYFRKTIAERQTDQDIQDIAAIRRKIEQDADPQLMEQYLKLYFNFQAAADGRGYVTTQSDNNLIRVAGWTSGSLLSFVF